MSMIKSKILSEYDLKEYQCVYEGKKYDMKIAVCGVFDSISIHWDYFAVSFITVSGTMRLTADLSKNTNMISTMTSDIGNVRSFFRKFETQHEADSFLKDFKLKWETASNNTTQVVREEKLKEILDGN
jgi:hypothetical protein